MNTVEADPEASEKEAKAGEAVTTRVQNPKRVADKWGPRQRNLTLEFINTRNMHQPATQCHSMPPPKSPTPELVDDDVVYVPNIAVENWKKWKIVRAQFEAHHDCEFTKKVYYHPY